MTAEDLAEKGMLRRIPVDWTGVMEGLKRSKRDIATAKILFKTDLDWCYAIAYSAALQAGRSLMYSEGYRPSSEKSHVSVIDYLKTRKEKEVRDMVGLLNNLRKKRHVVIYEEAGVISETAAENAIKWATEFVSIVDKIIEAEHKCQK